MSRAAWAGVAERGSMAGIWFTAQFYRMFGRRLSELFILPIVTYFFLTDRRGRRASRRYLERLHAWAGSVAGLHQAPTARDVFRHYHEFARATLDRLRFVLRDDAIDVVLHGREVFADLLADRRGAILLGAHLGSFEALRVLADREAIAVNVLMNTRHAPRINALFRRLNPRTDVRVIEPGDGLDTVFRLKACLERGEFVAILGDRLGDGARTRVVHAPFLGVPAPFPQGPYLLAHTLGCPIVLMVGLRRSATTFDVYAERLVERLVLPREQRSERLASLARRYAERLEAYCARAPFQWFNFFDFWEDER